MNAEKSEVNGGVRLTSVKMRIKVGQGRLQKTKVELYARRSKAKAVHIDHWSIHEAAAKVEKFRLNVGKQNVMRVVHEIIENPNEHIVDHRNL